MRIHPNTTCQICGRAIQANTGVIAHHGYKRPHQGWQTGSCFGARYRPYEESCDALPVAIERATTARDRQQADLDKLICFPPNPLEYYEKTRGAWSKPELFKVERPEGFDPFNLPEFYTYSQSEKATYAWRFKERKAAWAQNIKMIEADIEYLKKRLANWKAPK